MPKKILTDYPELEFIIALSKNLNLKPFFEKPYGINLLFLLDKCECENEDNGIEDTFESILISKPKKLAFVQYCAFLTKVGAIKLNPSDFKKSKKVMRLSKGVKKSMASVRRKFDIQIVFKN